MTKAIGKLIGKLNKRMGYFCYRCGRRFDSGAGVSAHQSLHWKEDLLLRKGKSL